MAKTKEVKVVKDFGSITVPTSWEQITLKQFIRLVRLQEGKEEGTEPSIVDIMAALTDTDRSFIYSLPSDFVDTIMAHLLFLNEPLDSTPSNSVDINGETYEINHMEKLKFGEHVDANTVIQNDKYNYSALLGILCRKKGEIYDDKYIAEVLDNRIEMWDNQPITKVYPIICFFLALSTLSTGNLEHYLTNVEQALNQSLNHIEDSLKDGVGKKHFMKYVKARWKLRKLRKCMSRLS